MLICKIKNKKGDVMKKKWILMSGIFLVGCSNTEEVAPSTTASSSSDRVESVTVTNEPNNESTLVFDDHSYSYDVVTGATVTTFGTNPPSQFDTQEEKLSNMFWSNQPPLGMLTGYYFRNEGSFDGGHLGIVEVVTDFDSKEILNVEFQEYASDNYYEAKYSGVNKRLSDYAFFQADNTRTDDTLVTIVNGITYVEKQMRDENRLTGDFKTVNGASTSVRNGFIPIAEELSEDIKKESSDYYYGYALETEDGLIGRLQVIQSGEEITDVVYDEYFADTQEAIKDDAYKPFYRQSKYHSIEFNELDQGDFKAFSDKLSQMIIENNSLDISDEALSSHPSFALYSQLQEEVKLEMFNK